MTKPRRDWSAERALGLAYLTLILLTPFSPALQMTGAELTGAVMPNHTSASRLGIRERVDIHSIGGDRRVLWGASEHAAALHLLVVLPAKKATLIDHPPGSADSPVERTIGGTYRLDDGAHRGAVVRAEATYDLFRRTATIGGARYRLSRGNLFVVRVDENLHPVVTQLDQSFGGMDDQRALLRAFRSGSRSDPQVRRALSAILDAPAPPAKRRNCARAAAPLAAT